MPIQTQTFPSASRISCSSHSPNLYAKEILTPFTLFLEVLIDKEEPFCIQNIKIHALMSITSLFLIINKFYANRK